MAAFSSDSPLAPSEVNRLDPRKGGGGGHGGASGHGGGASGHGGEGSSGRHGSGSGSKGGKKGSESTGSTTGEKSSSITMPGSTVRMTATTYSGGGGRAVVIPQGQPFSGLTYGSGTRGQVYGTSTYGSGYPGLPAGSVTDRGFPFCFWPVVWEKQPYGAPYLYAPEYGSPTNTSRPGGPLTQATFTSKTSNNTFWVVADNATVIALIATVHDSCTLGNGSSTNPSVFAGSTVRPDQVVQYYRASSVALALDGYNDTAKLNNPNASAIPLPGWVDNSFLKCLNSTIGESVPLVNGANAQFQAPVGLVGLLCLFIFLWF
ncbi:predicted protein [Postia placenta Mad-698-R]|nr:predicted protein [Postia placenta Mad-698-R]